MRDVDRFMRIRNKLIEKAKAGKLISYGDFMNRHYGVIRG